MVRDNYYKHFAFTMNYNLTYCKVLCGEVDDFVT